MLTIRLDKETEQELEYLKIKKGITKSELVKEALNLYRSRRKINSLPMKLKKIFLVQEEAISTVPLT